jgi:hypothetical protein
MKVTKDRIDLVGVLHRLKLNLKIKTISCPLRALPPHTAQEVLNASLIVPLRRFYGILDVELRNTGCESIRGCVVFGNLGVGLLLNVLGSLWTGLEWTMGSLFDKRVKESYVNI